jgi:hypothetical protein
VAAAITPAMTRKTDRVAYAKSSRMKWGIVPADAAGLRLRDALRLGCGLSGGQPLGDEGAGYPGAQFGDQDRSQNGQAEAGGIVPNRLCDSGCLPVRLRGTRGLQRRCWRG